jgi:MIP family channel proteins
MLRARRALAAGAAAGGALLAAAAAAAAPTASCAPAAAPPPALSPPPPSPPPLFAPGLARKLAFEAAGTGLIVLLGCGCVSSAKFLASGLSLGGASLVWGSTVALAVFATREASGAHLNPAVTAALAVHRPDSVPPPLAAAYAGAQVAGAAAGAAANYAVFGGAIRAFEAREKLLPRGAPSSAASFAGAFALAPSALRGPGTLAAEALATGALAFLIFAIGDPKNNVPGGAAPALVGASVTCLVAVFGPVTGAGMNPARDLGPRLVATAAGWRGTAASAAIYTVGPVCGAIAGGGLYDALSALPRE